MTFLLDKRPQSHLTVELFRISRGYAKKQKRQIGTQLGQNKKKSFDVKPLLF